MVPDAALVQQAQSGHVESFGLLVERYQDRVFNACWRICGNLEDARDVTQEAFLKALTGLGGFERKSGFQTWVFRIAVNLAISHRRKMKLRATVSLDQAADPSGSQAETLAARVEALRTSDPSSAAEQAELQRRAAAALQRLDDDHKAVVVLRDIEGLDYREIAAILDVPTGTVKSRLHRARLELRDAVLAPALKAL